MKILWAFLRRDLLNAASYKLSFGYSFLGIAFSTATFYFLSGLFGSNPVRGLEEYGGRYFPFVLVGIALTDYLATAIHSFSAQIREGQLTGTLEPLLLTRASLFTILLGSSLYPFCFTTFRVLGYFLLGVALGVSFSGANFLGAFLIFGLTIISFGALGIGSASFVMVFKRGDPVGWVFTSLSSLLGGVFYPVSVLPAWLSEISFILPITHALRGLRRCLLTKAPISAVLPELAILAGFVALLLPLSISIFGWAVRRAKRDGSLAHY